jgi:outer membrane biosynthesis protein TonB
VLRQVSSVLLAVVLHAAMLALALWMLSRQEPAPEIRIGSVPVTIVSDIVREAAPTPSPSEELFEEVTPDAAEVSESEATETPTPTPAPPTPTPPRQTPPRPPTQPQRPPQNPTRPPQTPPRQPPAQPQRPPREELNLQGLEGGSGPTRSPPGRPATESGSGDAPAATGQQVAFLAGQVGPHWILTFCEMAGGNDLTISMRMTVGSDGRITEGPTLVQPSSSSVYRAASESALRAVGAAAPFDVPDGFRTSRVRFDFPTAPACRRRG